MGSQILEAGTLLDLKEGFYIGELCQKISRGSHCIWGYIG